MVTLFFVWDLIVMVSLICLRCKIRVKHRNINSIIVLSFQILTELELFGIASLYYLLQQRILSSDLGQIKYATMNLCSDGVLAHALQYYASYVSHDINLIQSTFVLIGAIMVAHFLISIIFSIAFTKIRKSWICKALIAISDSQEEGLRRRKFWDDEDDEGGFGGFFKMF